MQLSHGNLPLCVEWGQICRSYQEGSETLFKYVKNKVGLSKGIYRIRALKNVDGNPLSDNDVMSEIMNMFLHLFSQKMNE